MNMNKMASSLESQVQISVYINDNLPEQGRNEIERMTRNMKSVSAIEYVPREKALQILQERLGENKKILDALGESNPLPNAFLVTVNNAADVKKTAAAISDLYGVDEVKYGQDVAANLFELTHLLRFFGVILMLLLLGATVFIISNTIRLTVFARRKEIAIMKLIGATDIFIRGPFMIEGMLIGLIGSVIPLTILYFLYVKIVAYIGNTFQFLADILSFLSVGRVFVVLVPVGLLLGVGIGFIGSVLTMRKHLDV